MDGPHLFVDGRNCIYRAIHANKDAKCHNLVVMLRFMKSWVDKYKPSSVHVFWDAPRKTVWRRKLLATYKDRSDTRDDTRDIRQELIDTQTAAVELFNNINVRQYARRQQEADDLIYAACRVVYPHDTIVVSSDGDFLQIPYFMKNVRLYEPRLNKFVEVPRCNPVIKKVLMGDNGDNIDGYKGIGKVKSAKLAESIIDTHAFVEATDREMFVLNTMLIDLSLCPYLLANQLYVTKTMIKLVAYNNQAAIALIGKHKLTGLLAEWSKIAMSFKSIK